MNKPLNIGLIGTGNHGSRYAKHILNDFKGKLNLTAISRRNRKKAQAQAIKWRCKYYLKWQDLVADPLIDAIISVTTPNLNYEIGKVCVSYKKPLLIEKPLDTDVCRAEKLVNLFNKKKISLTVSQTLRYNSIILALKDNFSKIGLPFSFCATHILGPSTVDWLENPAIADGDVAFHVAVHLFDALRFITGKEVVRVRTTSYKLINKSLDDLFIGQIEMEDNLVGIVKAGKICSARSGRYDFIGEFGHLLGDQIHGEIELNTVDQVTPLPHSMIKPAIEPLLNDWALFLAGKRSNPISGEIGLAAIKICEACRKSSEIDQWVYL